MIRHAYTNSYYWTLFVSLKQEFFSEISYAGLLTFVLGVSLRTNKQLKHFKNMKTRPIMDGFRKNNVNYWVFREIRSIIPHL